MSRSEREEVRARIRASRWFRHVDPAVLEGVADRIESVRLSKGSMLFRQGDAGDALYLIVAGRLRAFATREDGEEVRLAEMSEGESVGEIQVVSGGERTASVQALEDSELLEVPTAVFDEFARASPGMLAEMVELNRKRLNRSLLGDVLPGLLGPLDEASLAKVEAEVTWIELEAGEYLFREGEPGDKLYVLLRGRLEAVSSEGEGRERVLTEIARGECVGEMALLTGTRRSVSVRALRDSRLVSVSKAGFERLAETFPQAQVGLNRLLVDRLTRATGAPSSGTAASEVRTLAVIAADRGVPVEDFVERLKIALAAHGPTLRLGRERVAGEFDGRHFSGGSGEDPAEIRLSAWLDDQEGKHRFVIYEADPEATAWTAKCLRQADQILLVAAADRLSEIETLNRALDLEQRTGARSRSRLVVLHDGDDSPVGTGRALRALGVARHEHVRLRRDRDFERLGRLFAGRALGLALGGGGARAFAHIGVMRALEEAGLAIDMIGGTSVGAFIAGLYAQGVPPDAMVEICRRSFLEGKPHRDLTLPLFGFVTGRRGDRIAREAFGDREIEDLWINYFAISANLTRARQMVHSTGRLGAALRASMAVPGAVVPAVSGHDLLVDGGVLNNLPTDVMRRLCRGRVVAVDVSAANEVRLTTAGGRLPNPWKVFLSRLNPFMRSIKAPLLIEILARASTLASVQEERTTRSLADLYLKPPVDHFGLYQMAALDEIVEIGYRYARERLSDWDR